MRKSLLGFALSAIVLAAATPVSLPVSEDAWKPQVQSGVPAAAPDAVRMAVVTCSRGKCLSVGPYRAGRSGARYAYAKRIDGAAGVVGGWYRTTGLYPRQASVSVQFYSGEERIGSRTLSLDAAPGGAEFAAPVTHAPRVPLRWFSPSGFPSRPRARSCSAG